MLFFIATGLMVRLTIGGLVEARLIQIEPTTENKQAFALIGFRTQASKSRFLVTISDAWFSFPFASAAKQEPG
jgi:hypothetical protein